MNLNIHLDCSNTVMGTGYFKVHISEEIFQPLNIRKNDIIIIGFSRHETAGNAGNLLLIGTPAAIRDIVEAQTDA